MHHRLQSMTQRYEELSRILADPDVIADSARYTELLKEFASLEEIVTMYQEYQRVQADMAEADELLAAESDPEERQWIQDEREKLSQRLQKLEKELRKALLPRDPRDEKNVILEIRAGAGGMEAALFAADLLRLYQRYAERQGWRVEILSMHENDLGGIREAIILISGRGAYSRLKYESGVHRVQRVPITEASGRIHTSTATVAVLPEAEEVEVEINPDDLQIDTFRASGAGGQHVNKTESAIRITHLPTGLVVTCQDEKSQHKNRERAMKILRARLLDLYERERHAEEAEARRMQVGTGDRSERIRTYNFPQGRVTDHRIGLTLYRLEELLDGDLDLILDELLLAQESAQLEAKR